MLPRPSCEFPTTFCGNNVTQYILQDSNFEPNKCIHNSRLRNSNSLLITILKVRISSPCLQILYLILIHVECVSRAITAYYTRNPFHSFG